MPQQPQQTPSGASSTSDSETVSLRLPTGEMVDAIVPSGLSDDEVRSYAQMHRPDLFGAPAGVPTPPLVGTAKRGQASPQAAATMQTMSGGTVPSFLAHGAGSLGPGQPEAIPGMGAAGATGLAAGAGAAAPPTLPFLARMGNAAKPYIVPALASAAISKAKELPVVGPIVQKIPYAEMLPWLFNPQKEQPQEPLQEGAPYPENPYEKAQAAADKRQFVKNSQDAAKRQNQMETGIYPGAPLPEAPSNVPAKTKLGGRYILTPEEAQQSEQIQQIAKRRASERGMQYAAGMKPSGGKVPTP